MDELIAGGIAIVVILFAGAAVLIYGIIQLILWELHAIINGDLASVLGSMGVLVILCAAYLGTGYWLHRTGRI